MPSADEQGTAGLVLSATEPKEQAGECAAKHMRQPKDVKQGAILR